jgi:glycine hydroxymethyltransferase
VTSQTASREEAEALREATRAHHRFRSESLNLCAAETITSALVRELLASDFSRRYSTRTGAYSGSRYSDELERGCEEAACRIFGCGHATINPISGHIALLASLIACTEPGDCVITTSPLLGGYPIRIGERIGLRIVYLPTLDEEGLRVDADAACELIERERPALVIFGASEILFPAPLDRMVPTCRGVGARVAYDASHVLGLLAGGQFQRPFADDVDLVFGSTNKTFFGPHRGIVLVRDDDALYARILDLVDSPPFFQSSHHVASAVALGAAMAEMEAFGVEYASEVVAAAQALARALAARGVAVLGEADGFTRSHQVLLDCGGYGSSSAVRLQARLERAGILADLVVRFGTQQCVRLGMGASEMELVGELIADVVHEQRPEAEIAEDVRRLANRHRHVRFTFGDGEDAFTYYPLDDASSSRPTP